ncbi:hypothetical protein J2S92_004054 [Arthrobacter bambusae]|jgi:hypothetical protein|nr:MULTISPECIES: hypothetical protein [Arthrobacter]MDQ0213350.1 hypothetical protein [Arthrobacter bambusae]MDQ0237650.1 hypothetical protein [Arthrobacter bambusae]
MTWRATCGRADRDLPATGLRVERRPELVATYDTPVPGILTLLVVRPVVDFVTRNGPAPMLALAPRFDAVILTGPKLFDLR